MNKTLHAIFFTLLFITPIHSYAALNYSGTYEGSNSGTLSSCTNTGDDGPDSSFIVATINHTGSNFTASSADGTNVSGTIDSAGNFTATVNHDDGEVSSLSGLFSSSQMQFTENTTSPGPSGCFYNGSATLTKTSGAIVGSEVQIQQSQQIVRATNSLISQHLATEVSNAFSFMPLLPEQENSLGASSDSNNSTLAFWGTTSLTEIHEDSDNVANFDTDIYQFVGGFDKNLGKTFVGTALTYAYGETEQSGQDSTSHVIGVTPYMAYQLTDFMFISALGGYNYSYVKDENFGTDTDVHDYTLESNLNFFKTFMQSFIVKSRIGARFHHTYVGSTKKSLDSSTDELIWLGDLELGYRFKNKLTTYVGTYYEYFDREASAHHFKEHDGTLFMRGGLDYPIAHNITLGGKVQADLTDEDTDIITGSVSIRVSM